MDTRVCAALLLGATSFTIAFAGTHSQEESRQPFVVMSKDRSAGTALVVIGAVLLLSSSGSMTGTSSSTEERGVPLIGAGLIVLGMSQQHGASPFIPRLMYTRSGPELRWTVARW